LHLSSLDYLAAGGAALAAGVVNAMAGGGTLVSFPTLVALGVPAVASNVTNTVSLLPGYLSGTWAQRRDLKPQMAGARSVSAVAALGGLLGSVLLVTIPAHAFRVAVPYLILLSCALLLGQDRLRRSILGELPETSAGADPVPAGVPERRAALAATVFLAAVYGGFFGAGLGIMLLALLGLFSHRPLGQLNALKQGLSFVINLIAAAFFAVSGPVVWQLVGVMAVTSVVGGALGGRLVTRVDSGRLRAVVVVAGVAVAVAFFLG
jgi:uncharacterized membrane protein YfcA